MLFGTGFGAGRVVGMRPIVDAIFRVTGLVCRRARRSLRGCSLYSGRGFGFADRLGRVACMGFAAFVVRMRVFVMIGRIVIMLVRWLVIAKVVVVLGFG